jgi:hypothetical protein
VEGIIMSEETEAVVNTVPSIFFEETLEERVEALGKMVREIDDDYAALSARLNNEMFQYQDRLKQHMDSELRSLRSQIETTLADVRVRFAEKVREKIQEVSADQVAAALTKKVLVVRNANREESKSPDTLKIRQATPAEIRNQK